MNDDVLLDGEFLPHRVAVARLRENGISEGCAVAFASTLPCRASFASKKGQWVPWVRKKGAKKGQACWVLLGPDGRPTKYRDEKPEGAKSLVGPEKIVTDVDRVGAGIAENQDDPTAHHAMADILLEQGKHQEAEQSRHRAISLESPTWRSDDDWDGPQAKKRAKLASMLPPGKRDNTLRGVIKDAYQSLKSNYKITGVPIARLYGVTSLSVPNVTKPEFLRIITSSQGETPEGVLTLMRSDSHRGLREISSPIYDPESELTPRTPDDTLLPYIMWEPYGTYHASETKSVSGEKPARTPEEGVSVIERLSRVASNHHNVSRDFASYVRKTLHGSVSGTMKRRDIKKMMKLASRSNNLTDAGIGKLVTVLGMNDSGSKSENLKLIQSFLVDR